MLRRILSRTCFGLVLTRVRLVLIRVDSCRTRVDSCWLVSDSCWLVLDSCWLELDSCLLVLDSCWFVLTRVDLCWYSCIRIDLIIFLIWLGKDKPKVRSYVIEQYFCFKLLLYSVSLQTLLRTICIECFYFC